MWFHINGRGEGRHAGKIHYRMEYFAKKSNKRVFHRRQQAIDEAVKSEQPEMTEGVEEDMEGIVIKS